jgi:hypothetical protein
MKKILLLLGSLLGAGVIGLLVFDAWKTAELIRREGVEGSLKIDRQYNASRWAAPVPIKKIHVYAATLVPAYEVVVETDQELVPGKTYFVRFLTRDKAQPLREQALRPVSGGMRPRVAEDGKPPVADPTAALDRLVEKAMGSTERPAGARPAAGQQAKSVPFFFGGANDNVIELIWNNSASGEWVLLCVLVMLTAMTGLNGIFTPWREMRRSSEADDFIHPAMRKIEADQPTAPPPRLKLAPRPVPVDTEIVRHAEVTASTPAALKLVRKSSGAEVICAPETKADTKKAAGDSGGPS